MTIEGGSSRALGAPTSFGAMYLQIRTGLTQRTQQEHERALKFLRERLGDTRPVHKITPLDARQFISWFRKRKFKGKPIAPTTANKVLRECRRTSGKRLTAISSARTRLTASGRNG